MKYLSIYLFSALLFITCCIGANWLIDPFGMYWSPVIENVNALKPEAGNRTRVTKAYRANGVKPELLLVGNSRVEMGLDPNHAVFDGQRVYNQGMPGASLKMQLDYARNVIAASPELHSLVIGVDYLDFLQNAEQPPSGAITRLPGYWPRLDAIADSTLANSLFRLKEKGAMLFSLDALVASANTLSKQQDMKSSISPLGLNTAKTYQEILLYEGIKPLYVQKLESLKKRLSQPSLRAIVPERGGVGPLQQLRLFLDEVLQRDVKVYVFISPYHYSYLQLLDELGYRQDFLAWKRQLVTLLDGDLKDQLELWDFSKLNDYTLEKVPLNGKQSMKWYWEPAHYKKELGDLLLERMIGKDSTLAFGQRVFTSNIDSSLGQDGVDLEQSKHQWLELKAALALN